MKIEEILVPELKHEAAITQKFLKRIPNDKMDWRPHPKSMTMGELGNHLAEIPGWITGTMETDEMDMEGYEPTRFKSATDLEQAFQKNVTEATKALNKPDEDFQKNWKMTQKGQILMEMPKLSVLRTMVMNQIPHHRAQLGVYFRLLDIPVPASYGPSADES
ncbi:DinB family protein [Gillisia sp. M10.2A]|uniref:DinB family protein n=1 Tax=Gillisia lutea TaxID=2909668 RepID=A0ABS9EI34_9FLAO|nr:DinB family protein [Gillisia lutea]MCF4102520.1 DinB family protein [Gillisia lutea]